MPKSLRLLSPLFLIILSACSFSLAEDIVPPEGSQQQPVVQPSPITVSDQLYPIVPPDPANGAAVYAEKCQPCHGDQGLGDGPKSSLSSVPVAAIGTAEIARPAIPAEWYSLLTTGDLERGMPPFNSLSDRQKWDVIAYVYQLSAPGEVISLGEQVYKANCLRCHGKTGQGDGPDADNIPLVPQDLTDQELMAGLSDLAMYDAISKGVGDTMPDFADDLQASEIWAVAAYLRNQTFVKREEAQASVEPTPTSGQTDLAYPEPTQQDQAYPEPTAVAAPTEIGLGTVRVELIDPSGAGIASDTPVTLYGFDNMLNTYSQTLTTNDQGIYLFNEVEMLPGRAFIAGADYSGGTYGSDVVVAEEGTSELVLQVQVFESSSDTSQLSIDRAHIFLDFIQDGMVQVVEVFILSNPTNFSIVSATPGGPVVNFLLPEGAVDLQFQDGVLGERYVLIPGGFADTSAVQPGSGQYQVVFAFNMPYDGKLDFSQPIGMQSGAVVIMLPDVGIRLKGSQISDDGTRDMQGSLYHLYSAPGMQAGDTLEFTLSGKPKSGSQLISTATSSTRNITIGLGAFGLALVGAGVWLFIRNRNQDMLETEMGFEQDQLTESIPETVDAGSLMDAIIALDDLYQAGKLPEEAYLKRRDELKAQLQKAMGEQG